MPSKHTMTVVLDAKLKRLLADGAARETIDANAPVSQSRVVRRALELYFSGRAGHDQLFTPDGMDR